MPAEPNHYSFTLTNDPAPVIGGTLCLMSCALTSMLNATTTDGSVEANPFYIKRIADNLALLADNTMLDAHFRRVCRRLFEHWESRLNAITHDQAASAAHSQTPACACAEALASTIRFH
jgi:hypothetical protein